MANVELQQIGEYSISRLLSTSSTQSLYLGKQLQRKKDVLIQLLHTPLATPEARQAFVTYAQQLRRLKHRSIVEVQKADFLQDTEEHDCGYLVTEYITGEPLRQHILPGSCLGTDEVKRIITPIADALQYAHTLGIVHGNLHPGNIIKSARGELFLTNFSLALPATNLPLDPDEEAMVLPYTAPEVLQGAVPTAASDQYALAAMAYQWLCGQPPYDATDRATLLLQQEQAPIPAPRSLNEAISIGIERVLLQALARNPEERFQSVSKFSDIYLRTLMGLPVEIKAETRILTTQTSMPVYPVLKDRAKVSVNVPDKNIEAEKEYKQSLPDRQIEQHKGKMQPKTRIPFNPKNAQTTSNTEEISITVSKRTTSQEITNDTVSKHLYTNRLLRQRYRIVNKRGHGGFGHVYKAEDTQIGNRLVAIKELLLQEGLSPQEIAETTKTFKSEAEMLASLKHPNLPSIIDYFDENGICYIVMDYIEGQTLEEYLNKLPDSRLSLRDTLTVGLNLCNVLNYLHNRQPPIVYRDLKPANIMLTSEGYLYLIDFGIARHFKQGQAKDTRPLGTWGYAPPEQHGHGQTDAKSDIYSLGATLHQLISGINPSENPFSFISLQSFDPLIPAGLSSLIAWMVEKDTNKRPPDMVFIKQELENIANELSTDHSAFSSKKLILGPTYGDTIHDEITEEIPFVQIGATSETKISFNKMNSVSRPQSLTLHQKVVADLEQGGELSKSLPGYEERPAQVEMATVVARSLTEDIPSIIRGFHRYWKISSLPDPYSAFRQDRHHQYCE